MNRREAITGSVILAAGALLPGTNISAEENVGSPVHGFSSASPNQKYLTTTAVVDDPDVEQIKITVLLKEGHGVPGVDSYVIERALLKHVGTNLISWFQYCRDNGMKTL